MSLKELVTKESLTESYPQIMAEIQKETHEKGYAAGLDQGKKEGFVSGSEAERSRIMGLQELSLPGHEKIVKDAIADGKSTKADAALQIVAAEKVILGTKLNFLKSDASETDVVGAAAIADVEPKTPQKTFETEVARVEKEDKISRAKAIQKVARENPDLHDEWVSKLKPAKND
jgi:hypothetical protein